MTNRLHACIAIGKIIKKGPVRFTYSTYVSCYPRGVDLLLKTVAYKNNLTVFAYGYVLEHAEHD